MSDPVAPERIRHLLSPVGDGEFSFCGLAYDSFGTKDNPTDDEFVADGLKDGYNCPECFRAISEIRKRIRGVTYWVRRDHHG